MLGHKDTKNADRLGHRDIKNADNLGHRDTETVDIRNPKLVWRRKKERRKKERKKKSRNIKSPTFIGLGDLITTSQSNPLCLWLGWILWRVIVVQGWKLTLGTHFLGECVGVLYFCCCCCLNVSTRHVVKVWFETKYVLTACLIHFVFWARRDLKHEKKNTKKYNIPLQPPCFKYKMNW